MSSTDDDITPAGIELTDEDLRMASGGFSLRAKDKTVPILSLRGFVVFGKKPPKSPPPDEAPNGDKIDPPAPPPKNPVPIIP